MFNKWESYDMYVKLSKQIFLFFFAVAFLSSCAMQETPRDASSVSSSNTRTLTAPAIIDSDEDFIDIRYAQMSMGFDPSCNPNRLMRDELNECAKLPENVKEIAMKHCEAHSKKAVFLGNRTTLLQMTLSKFKCE